MLGRLKLEEKLGRCAAPRTRGSREMGLYCFLLDEVTKGNFCFKKVNYWMKKNAVLQEKVFLDEAIDTNYFLIYNTRVKAGACWWKVH